MAIGTFRLSVKPYIDRAKLSDITLTSEEIGRYIKAALRSSCKLIRDYARTHHKYRDNSGRLTRGIKYDVYSGTRSKNQETWYGSVGYIDASARPEYAKWQLYGTGLYSPEGAHMIRPKSASFLRYKGENGQYRNKWITTHATEGIKGQDYLRNAYIKNKVKIDNIFEYYLQLLLKTKRR